MNEPPDIKDALAVAIRAHREGRLPEAERAYQAILEAAPENAEALHLLGALRLQCGDSERAADLIARAVAAEPGHADAHHNLGIALKALGRLGDAAAAYRRALAIDPERAATHFNLGNVLFGLGEMDAAAEAFRQTTALAPADAKAHYNLGNTLKALGQWDEAIASYRRAVAADPARVQAHYNLANTLRDMAKLDEAIASYRQAVALDPDYAEAHNGLGNALMDRGAAEEAVACYRRALALEPDFAHAHANLGMALAALGKRDEAIASYRRALALDREGPWTHLNYALALVAGDKGEDGWADYVGGPGTEGAGTAAPDDPWPARLAHVHRAVERATGRVPVRVRRLTGSSHAFTCRLRLADGRSVVAKSPLPTPANALDPELEAYMVRYLAAHSELPVAEVLHADATVLVMDYVDSDGFITEADTGAQEHAAELLAGLHRITAPRFGHERDTLFGPSPQPNGWCDSWLEFFRDRRLLFMGRRALDAGWLPGAFMARLEAVAANLSRWLDGPEQASLVHGDVWSQNVLVRGGRVAAFLDPAIYHGDPEFDLALALRHQLGAPFLRRYGELRPLRPGFMEARQWLYRLSPALFGLERFGSRNLPEVDHCLKRLGF